jgi:hypothetical protein
LFNAPFAAIERGVVVGKVDERQARFQQHGPKKYFFSSKIQRMKPTKPPRVTSVVSRKVRRSCILRTLNALPLFVRFAKGKGFVRPFTALPMSSHAVLPDSRGLDGEELHAQGKKAPRRASDKRGFHTTIVLLNVEFLAQQGEVGSKGERVASCFGWAGY